jgi:hypothetical protein
MSHKKELKRKFYDEELQNTRARLLSGDELAHNQEAATNANSATLAKLEKKIKVENDNHENGQSLAITSVQSKQATNLKRKLASSLSDSEESENETKESLEKKSVQETTADSSSNINEERKKANLDSNSKLLGDTFSDAIEALSNANVQPPSKSGADSYGGVSSFGAKMMV